MLTVLNAHEVDGRGVDDLKIITLSISEHQNQLSDLFKRRKQLILRLRKQRITYRELAEVMGVSEQLIYKIIRLDIDRVQILDDDGKPVRGRGRPPKPLNEIVLKTDVVKKLNSSQELVSGTHAFKQLKRSQEDANYNPFE